MKPIIQLYALCIDQLPGYDKDEEYWQNVDKELLTKPMYQDNIRRKNRLDNLKLLNVKELLFDKYINILSEPKVKKISKSVKANKITNIETVNDNKNIIGECDEIISTDKEKMKKPDKNIEDGTFKVDIKITKNIKTGVIISSAYIGDGIYKIWKYQKNNCKDKNKEVINIISKIINYDKNKKYVITLNNKKFITEYNTAVVYYKDIEKSKETNILDDIFNTQNIGDLKIINNIRRFKDIIGDYKMFSIVSK
jgi:hypothetical protein